VWQDESPTASSHRLHLRCSLGQERLGYIGGPTGTAPTALHGGKKPLPALIHERRGRGVNVGLTSPALKIGEVKTVEKKVTPKKTQIRKDKPLSLEELEAQNIDLLPARMEMRRRRRRRRRYYY
jgi:hypothetical protein